MCYLLPSWSPYCCFIYKLSSISILDAMLLLTRGANEVSFEDQSRPLSLRKLAVARLLKMPEELPQCSCIEWLMAQTQYCLRPRGLLVRDSCFMMVNFP